MTDRKPSEEIIAIAVTRATRVSKAFGLPAPPPEIVAQRPENMIEAILTWLDANDTRRSQ